MDRGYGIGYVDGDPALGQRRVGDVQVSVGLREYGIHPKATEGNMGVIERIRLVTKWIGVVAAHA